MYSLAFRVNLASNPQKDQNTLFLRIPIPKRFISTNQGSRNIIWRPIDKVARARCTAPSRIILNKHSIGIHRKSLLNGVVSSHNKSSILYQIHSQLSTEEFANPSRYVPHFAFEKVGSFFGSSSFSRCHFCISKNSERSNAPFSGTERSVASCSCSHSLTLRIWWINLDEACSSILSQFHPLDSLAELGFHSDFLSVSLKDTSELVHPATHHPSGWPRKWSAFKLA